MPKLPNARICNALVALVALVAMLVALYLQHYQGLEPCPLCVFQRVAVIGVGVMALIAAVHGPQAWGQRVYAGVMSLSAVAGVVVAGRHVWLQHLPADQVPSCGPGLDFWIAALPWQQVVQQVFQGSGECAKVDWTLLGLSLPMWTLMLFIGLLLAALVQLVRRPN
ncbi:disulfide bond formation protein B [Perlucidibaca aquatica]|uniref:disulfide bond formation protein B n=1 Tax=Perlucidibaca aquatica TaxID=1852776 RepID=UPI00083AF31A|nr:disulfide bond formation protein B [Perlucidibaca aquatica]